MPLVDAFKEVAMRMVLLLLLTVSAAMVDVNCALGLSLPVFTERREIQEGLVPMGAYIILVVKDDRTYEITPQGDSGQSSCIR